MHVSLLHLWCYIGFIRSLKDNNNCFHISSFKSNPTGDSDHDHVTCASDYLTFPFSIYNFCLTCFLSKTFPLSCLRDFLIFLPQDDIANLPGRRSHVLLEFERKCAKYNNMMIQYLIVFTQIMSFYKSIGFNTSITK